MSLVNLLDGEQDGAQAAAQGVRPLSNRYIYLIAGGALSVFVFTTIYAYASVSTGGREAAPKEQAYAQEGRSAAGFVAQLQSRGGPEERTEVFAQEEEEPSQDEGMEEYSVYEEEVPDDAAPDAAPDSMDDSTKCYLSQNAGSPECRQENTGDNPRFSFPSAPVKDRSAGKMSDELSQRRYEQLMMAMKSPSDLNLSSATATKASFIPSADAPGQDFVGPLSKADLDKGRGGGRGSQGNGSLDSYSKLKQASYRHDSEVEGVDTPYMLRQGTIIPSILLSSVNSDLPGQILAQVTDDVLDSPVGKHVLIPRGSKLVGQYGSSPEYGQERLMMAFNRIIFPDGKAMDIGAMPGTGTDGFSGADAHVNNHLFRLFTSSVLLAGVGTTVILTSQNSYNSDGEIQANSAFAQSLSESLGQTATKIIERNLNVSPTLEVMAGYFFNVTLIKDLRFRGPYEAFDDYATE